MPLSGLSPSSVIRRLLSALLLLIAFPVILLLMQVAFFAWILTGEKALQEADVIVVFEGAYQRTLAGYTLVDQSYAPNLVLTPATEQKLKHYDKVFKPSKPFARILEDKARTTSENAVYTREILREGNFRSAILVTSWNHMPRAYFLLKVFMPFSGIKVQLHPVATGRLNQTNWHQHRMGWLMVYNEAVEFWGSVIELGKYVVTGELPEEPPGVSDFAARLKERLLFKVDHKLLHE